MTIDLTPEEIERYAPYHTMPAFQLGFADYANQTWRRNAGDNGALISSDSVSGQAYDRGAECAMRRQRKAVL